MWRMWSRSCSLSPLNWRCKQGSISLTRSCTQTHSRLTLRWIKMWGKTRAGSHTHAKGIWILFWRLPGLVKNTATGGVNTFSCLHRHVSAYRCCTLVKWNIYLAYLFITIHKTCMQLIKINMYYKMFIYLN